MDSKRISGSEHTFQVNQTFICYVIEPQVQYFQSPKPCEKVTIISSIFSQQVHERRIGSEGECQKEKGQAISREILEETYQKIARFRHQLCDIC